MNPANEIDRVRKNTTTEQLRKIEEQIERSVRFYATQSPETISERIRGLEEEWSMERWLETNASALAFTGVALGLTVNRKWFALPLIVSGFLFQHAIQGWCPPVPLLRRLGIRTRSEIDREKFALKILRGDFEEAADAAMRRDQQDGETDKVLAAVSA
ncbi:MAG TPA: hypothetical protein VFV23_00040 [Verrucomicrobiae bacterium]|nr:hypothetical protein [Verrucomicrobiae bacterium]